MIRGYGSGVWFAGMDRGPENLHIQHRPEIEPWAQAIQACALPTELTWLWSPWADRHASGMGRVWFGYGSGTTPDCGEVVVAVAVAVAVVVVVVVVVVAAAAAAVAVAVPVAAATVVAAAARVGVVVRVVVVVVVVRSRSRRGSGGSSSSSSSSSSIVSCGVWFGGMVLGYDWGYGSGVGFVHVEPSSLLKPWTHNKWKGSYI